MSLYLERIDVYADAYVKISINWSTDQWQTVERPPLPSELTQNLGAEDVWIRREIIHDGPLTSAKNLTAKLEIGYCPTWVSIDIQGNNYKVDRGVLNHVCVPDQEVLFDYGDCPDPTYPTLEANDGAAHFVDGRVYLGTTIDAEADGQPNATATGDDDNNLDDEDGVTFTSPLIAAGVASIDVEASTFGLLSAWIDFNIDGDWNDPGEQIFTNEPLSQGVNGLSFPVPADAAAGNTCCRFRFSSFSGLSYKGKALNGEVEDYAVKLERKVDEEIHYKWQQPPIEYDPYATTPVYCGWDQPSYVVVQGDYAGAYTPATPWNFVADNFHCFGSMPVTSVHWWGSYVGWAQTDFPSQRPVSWLIGFWSNVPADAQTPYGRPGTLLKAVTLPAERVNEVWVGRDRFPDKPEDTCYKYSTQFQPDDYFWQERYVDQTTDRVYWLSVTAIYNGTRVPSTPWGWKTRPAHWRDDAVHFRAESTRIDSGWTAPRDAIQPLENSAVCNFAESYDLAFALGTHPDYVKWDQSFTSLRDWPYYEDRVSIATLTGDGNGAVKWEQPPDVGRTGVDVDGTYDFPQTWPPQILADDFLCETSGPITGIDIWGSWFSDILPVDDATNVQFTLSIHADIPAGSGATPYSRPGAVLWSERFAPGEFSVTKPPADVQSFYHPGNRWNFSNNHESVYRYRFDIGGDTAFRQTGTEQQPVVYWLSVQAYIIHEQGYQPTRWGWKTSTEEWNDVAVYARGTDPSTAGWQTLPYPTQHEYRDRKMGLAFRVTTAEQAQELLVHYQVADDWLCDTPAPITAAAWWGSYRGYDYPACACREQTPPKKPLFFWLSLWTDYPDPFPNFPTTFSRPEELAWSYRAYEYDEVLVGYDGSPQDMGHETDAEAVYRYSVQIPEESWFHQPGDKQVYWFSVVAVYEDLTTVPYQWGWTNHRHVYNDNAVSTFFPYSVPAVAPIPWTPLYDRTNAREDMSFMLFTHREPVVGNDPDPPVPPVPPPPSPTGPCSLVFGVGGITVCLSPTPGAPAGSYSACVPITLELNFRGELTVEVSPTSPAGGDWSGSITPSIVGPGQVTVSLCINGTDVDISALPGGSVATLAQASVFVVPAN